MLYMVCHSPSIYPSHVSIYTIRLDSMGIVFIGLSTAIAGSHFVTGDAQQAQRAAEECALAYRRFFMVFFCCGQWGDFTGTIMIYSSQYIGDIGVSINGGYPKMDGL